MCTSKSQNPHFYQQLNTTSKSHRTHLARAASSHQVSTLSSSQRDSQAAHSKAHILHFLTLMSTARNNAPSSSRTTRRTSTRHSIEQAIDRFPLIKSETEKHSLVTHH